MNKIFIASLSLLLTSLALTSCGGNTNSNNTSEDDSLVIVPIELPTLAETQGTVGGGTTMNAIEIITTDGDTVVIEVPGGQVMGAVSVGDDIDIVYSTSEDGNVASVATNLTALRHLWTQRGADGTRQSLELLPNGLARTYDMRVQYSSWECSCGQLMLHQPRKVGSEEAEVIDTFQIMQLTADTLVLSSHNMLTIFECDN